MTQVFLSNYFKLFLFAAAFIANQNINAQNAENMHAAINTLNLSANPELHKKSADLIELTQKIVPTIYLENNQLNNIDPSSATKRIITDVNSIELLYNTNNNYQSVELICIKLNNINELNAIVDVTKLSNFKNLQYIYILCPFLICEDQNTACESQKINKMVINTPSTIKVIYTSEKSE